MLNKDTESCFRREEEEGEYRLNSDERIGTSATDIIQEFSTATVNRFPGLIPGIKKGPENHPKTKEAHRILNFWLMMSRQDPLKVTLSAFTEIGKTESDIPVLKQRHYIGRGVIRSTFADTPYAEPILLDILYPKYSAVFVALDSGVVKCADFGTAYAYLRPYLNKPSIVPSRLATRKDEDRRMRRSVLVDGRITTRHVPPRRVWDLYANRVIPYWVAHKHPWGISHAWVDEKDRIDVMTPINGCEWPVPMPKDANLNLIRIEMLNLGAEYAWLDVLCLRQEGGKGEDLRLEEWKLDVPTIGSVFEKAGKVVCYFNGLGRPLCLTTDYFESDRCWFRRAWTLQEIAEDYIIAGDCGDDMMEESVRRRFDEQLKSLHERRGVALVSEMQHRVSTKPLDKVAGLAYLLQTDSIPIYDPHQSPADAWEVLMEVVESDIRLALLFRYHEPGDGRKYWRPSWEQAMRTNIVVQRSFIFAGQVATTGDPDADCYTGYRIKTAYVHGLSEVKTEAPPRQGELVLIDATAVLRTFKVVADHPFSIPDGLYTLLSCHYWFSGSHLWVIGKLRDDGKFEKLSVLRSADDEQERLLDMGLEEIDTFLC
ncbi:hypothetical protein IW261DRAFT_1521966 [Armillaria novae-zelandiae]|uniref:Heterokaryon incompatibility domain-containing protein n=1 Tax=Armillaria novae-zelandiae TaxID=153914 RepID=A0AA39NIV8_9AGAR|nr:hypothetical protein IW261DRAFT_1521966 [Armillaria novae-zelandiae]